MSTKTSLQSQFAYHWQTTRRLMTLAAGLSQADYRAADDYGDASIHSLLFHLLDTDYSWRIGLESGRQSTGFAAADYPDLESLQIGIDSEEAAWTRFIDALSEEDLDQEIELISLRGATYSFSRQRVLQHLILHGMQHHSELARLLTLKGHSPGNIDYIFFQG